MLCMVAFYVVKWYKKKRREQRATALSSGIEGQYSQILLLFSIVQMRQIENLRTNTMLQKKDITYFREAVSKCRMC